MSSKVRSEKLKNMVNKLLAALEFMANQGINASGVCNIVNSNLEEVHQFSLQDISKLKKVDKKGSYISKYTDGDFTRLLYVLDTVISEEYQYSYNGKEYQQHINDTIRFDAFLGTYIGYSWNNTMTNGATDPNEEYLHRFKVEVLNRNLINCYTKLGTFTATKMMIVGTSNIAIELFNELRRIYLIIQIGNAGLEDLKRTETFKVAYADSGTSNAKCGLALLERTDKTSFESLKPDNVMFGDVKREKGETFIGFLRFAQLVIY